MFVPPDFTFDSILNSFVVGWTDRYREVSLQCTLCSLDCVHSPHVARGSQAVTG